MQHYSFLCWEPRMHADNRRAFPRAPLAVQLQAVTEGGLHSVACRNVSEGGACLRIDGVAQSETVKLFLPMPARDSGRRRLCLLEAEVCWRSGEHVGVRFLDPPPESLRQLRAFVSRAA